VVITRSFSAAYLTLEIAQKIFLKYLVHDDLVWHVFLAALFFSDMLAILFLACICVSLFKSMDTFVYVHPLSYNLGNLSLVFSFQEFLGVESYVLLDASECC
jgi:hypothetical protein